MSSNTIKRILSAAILVFIVGLSIFLGRTPVSVCILLFSLLTIDEIHCNFFKRKRFSLGYILNNLMFVIPFSYFNFLNPPSVIEHLELVTYMALVQGLILLLYLFFISLDSSSLKKIIPNYFFLTGLFILLPSLSISSLILIPSDWRILFITFLLISVGADIGGWFFGKNFGQKKLWVKISPQKTLVGFIGGTLFSILLSSLFWVRADKSFSLGVLILFCSFSILSQLGDLIQSKIKRQVGAKDSSNIIPGHGGVYDRVDGLFFIAPFFTTMYYHGHI